MDIILLILMSALHIYPTKTISTHHVRAVSPRNYYPNGPLPPDKTNWEIGLKEATFQALIREQISDPRLKEAIYGANIEGFQNSATPFGDIAVIARGQLFSTPHGYQFVQDPYQNDCDDCHTPHRCDKRQCEPQINHNLDNLMALWTVKRIRHRDPKFGHRFELQFTISPMSPAASAQFVTRNGRYDYGIPGHVFIVKLKENGATDHIQNTRNNFKFDKEHKNTDQKEFKILPWGSDIYNHNYKLENTYHQTPNSIVLNTGEYYIPQNTKTTVPDHVFNPGFLIGISPNGYKHVIHDIPGFVEQKPYLDDKPFITHDSPIPKEPVKHLHHHYYIPEVTDIDYDKKQVKPTTLTTTSQDEKYFTSYKPILPTADNINKFILTTNNAPETTTNLKQVFTQETTNSQIVPPLTTQGLNFGTTYKYPDTTIPIAINPTDVYNTVTYPKTTIFKVVTVPESTPTHSTPFSSSPLYIQYSEPDPIYNNNNNNQIPTVPTYISNIQPTVPTYVTIQDTNFPRTSTIQETNFPKTPTIQETTFSRTPTIVNLYNELGNTQVTTSTPSTTKSQKYPDSINAQLPAPEKGTDTTIPYISSTAITILSTVGSTEPTTHDKDSTETRDSLINTERTATTIHETIQTTTNKPVYETDETFSKQITSFDDFTTGTTVDFDNTQITSNLPLTTKRNNDKTTTDFDVTHITSNSPLTTNRNKNSKDDELFDVVQIPKKTTKVVYEDDFDIFGNSKKSKTMPVTKSTTTETSEKKPNAFDEIFSDFKSSTENIKSFLTPHTQLSINTTDAMRNARISKYLKYKRNKANQFNRTGVRRKSPTVKENKPEPENRTEDNETKTSQSFITSISFKVNKNHNKTENISESSVHNDQTTKKSSTTDRSQTFDDVAQTLVNHAKIVSYLNTKSTKPTRRSYKLGYRERS